MTENTQAVVSKERNYSFLHRNQEGLDSVAGEDGKEFVIPATPGTWYWAILRYCYENHDKPLTLKAIIDGAVEIYSGRDPEKFETYKNKDKIKVYKEGQLVEREANNWEMRIGTNVKTLTRHGGNNPYGKRLRERGHILRWEPDQMEGQGAFVLRTNTSDPLPRTKKKKNSSPISK